MNKAICKHILFVLVFVIGVSHNRLMESGRICDSVFIIL